MILKRFAVLLSCLLALYVPVLAQGDQKTVPPKAEIPESELPAFAVSLVISLANDARSYSDLALRPRVLARAADVLWDADNVNARSLFKRAWEAAENADAEEVTVKTKDNPPAMVLALRRMSGRDLRFEVLSLMARHDRALSEEFFAKLKSESERDQKGPRNSTPVEDDGWLVSENVSKRLQVASALLKEQQTERALEFAAPVLNQVNVHTINFLSELRAKNPEAADRVFAQLLSRAELDPAADGNTVSGLSSYVFTPGVYLTFPPEGGVRWSQSDEPSAGPPQLSPALRDRFFQVAASILLRPLPQGDQQSRSSARNVQHNVIKRLLPFFEQYKPDIAAALRARLTQLSSGSSDNWVGNDDFMLNQGIRPEPSADDALEQMQNRLDRAKTSGQRDQIYAATAAGLLAQGDTRARDVADKIENSTRRTEIRQYIDFEFARRAIRNKAAKEAIRIAQTGKLSSTQRASIYIDAAQVLRDAEPQYALELLEEAVREVRRIETEKIDRALLLVGVANQFVSFDRVRAWEIIGEAVKEANRFEEFTGENTIAFPLMTQGSAKFIRIGGENFSLSKIFRLLADDDLYRAVDLVKSFKYDAPRATVTLAVARAILEKAKSTSPETGPRAAPDRLPR